jgi:hypothetical protein
MPIEEKFAELLYEPERRRFLPLLLSNPNYFGNLKKSPLKPVKEISSNTSYEQLECVGFNPELNTLEGVVWIKQTAGYNGGICTNGSLEYVSFYLSYDNGATWLSQGTTNFPVYDVPGPKPLEYAVSVAIQPDRKFCFENNLPLMRAILSWSVPPTGPDFIPVWGNVLDARIQIEGFELVVDLPILLKAAEVKLPPAIAGLVSEAATVKLQAPKALTAAELKEQYAKSNVPAQRFLHNSIQKALQNPTKLTAMSGYYAGLGIDVGAAVSALEKTNGNTDYEQLGCIGLDEGTGSPDALVGTLVIKLPTGYLGGPCTAGSKEYVAFWIDWGSGWQWVGTPWVNVYDISSIPKGGLHYAVYQPVDLNSHRKPCGDGPITAKVRAILSWDTPPPSSDPNYVPVWGNRLDTLVLVNPGAGAQPGDFTPYLSSICEVPICSIDQTSGWAYPGTSDAPFGATVSIFGNIPGAPLFTWPLPPQPLYQITVQQLTPTLGPVQILANSFQVTLYQQIGAGPMASSTIWQNAPGGYYTYQNLTPNPGVGTQYISPQGLLGVWNTTPGEGGTWQITLTAWDATLTTKYPAGGVVCPGGAVIASVVIDLDEATPVTVPPLTITGYMPGGVGPCVPAVDCATFTVGDIICGSYSVWDEHLDSFSLQAEPTTSPTSGFTISTATPTVAGPFSVNGLSYPNALLPLTGPEATTTVTGQWTYNTAGLPPCGYTIQLFTGDRTIVDCVTNWENNSNFVGFCLVAPKSGT